MTNKLFNHNRRIRYKLQGLCATCGKSKDSQYITCKSCRDTSNRVTKKRQDYLNNLKSGPCADCKQQFNPWQMDFDHREPINKVDCVSYLASLSLINLEIEKCDLVCSNCHRQRTHDRSIKSSQS